MGFINSGGFIFIPPPPVEAGDENPTREPGYRPRVEELDGLVTFNAA